jgi:predicted metal-dependent peptidase
MSDSRKLLAAMRVGTFDYLPYLAHYVYALKEHRSPGIQTMAVDQNANLYWCPSFIESITKDEGSYVILHEVLHLLFRHFERAKDLIGEQPGKLERLVANVAGDLVIEQALSMMRQHRPEGAIYLGIFVPQFGFALDFPEDLRLEDYYRLIMERMESDPPDDSAEQDAPDGESESESGGEGQDGGDSGDDEADDPQEGADEDDDESSGKGDGSQSSGDGQPADQPCAPMSGGSCADGVSREYEVADDGAWEGYGEDLAAAGADKALAEFEASNPGTVPGSIRKALNAKLRPVADPWSQLRSAVATSVAAPVGGRESTYRRLPRKLHPEMLRLRGHLYTQPRAVVILDTSGSMRNLDMEARAISCIAQGLRKLARFKVICGDTRITSRKDVQSIKQIDWMGGGGTDMARVVEEVDREEKPDSIVLVTDCYTPWPARPTRARLVVACTSNDPDAFDSVPSWSRKVLLATERGA